MHSGPANLSAGAGAAAASLAFPSNVQAQAGPQPGDRVCITNEDSNTLSAINAVTDTVEATINLASYDEESATWFNNITTGMFL